jgi:hypothetical protein
MQQTSRLPPLNNYRADVQDDLLVGYNDLETTDPTIASEWHPVNNGRFTPKDVTRTSRKKVWWLGSCGYPWEDTIDSRSKGGSGCPVCADKKVLIRSNDIETIALEWLIGGLKNAD